MRFIPLLLILGLLLAERPAAASPDAVAILELRFKDIPPALTADLRTRLQQTLAAEGYGVLSEELVAKRLRELSIAPGCSLGPCLAPLGHALLAARALSGGIAAQGSSYDLVLTMLETGGGTVLAQVSERCEVCTFKEAEELMGRAAQELHKKALVLLATRATLTITSTPGGATVLLDSLPAGKAPLTLVLAPGRHLIEVVAKQALAFKKEVVLAPGKSYTVKANLFHQGAAASQQQLPTPPARGGVRFWLKWAALGGGVLLGGVGGGLWALDGQETGDPRYVHDTKIAGATMVGLGAAAVLGAAALYLLEPASERPDRSSAAAGQQEAVHAQ